MPPPKKEAKSPSDSGNIFSLAIAAITFFGIQFNLWLGTACALAALAFLLRQVWRMTNGKSDHMRVNTMWAVALLYLALGGFVFRNAFEKEQSKNSGTEIAKTPFQQSPQTTQPAPAQPSAQPAPSKLVAQTESKVPQTKTSRHVDEAAVPGASAPHSQEQQALTPAQPRQAAGGQGTATGSQTGTGQSDEPLFKPPMSVQQQRELLNRLGLQFHAAFPNGTRGEAIAWINKRLLAEGSILHISPQPGFQESEPFVTREPIAEAAKGAPAQPASGNDCDVRIENLTMENTYAMFNGKPQGKWCLGQTHVINSGALQSDQPIPWPLTKPTTAAPETKVPASPATK